MPLQRKNMKPKLTLITAIALGAFASLQAQPPGGHRHMGRGHGLEQLTASLNLTDAQKAKVQPIIDQARPQLQAIHQDAMAKAKAVMDTSISQLRPILTPEQQTKLDAEIKARQDMMNAMKEMREARSQ